MEWRTVGIAIPITHGLVTIVSHFTHSQRQPSSIPLVLYLFAVPGGLTSKQSCQSGAEHANGIAEVYSGHVGLN